jgi:hypothetical protein
VIDSEINVEEGSEIGGEAELNNLWETLQKSGEVEGELADYLAVDQELVTGGTLTTDEIVELCWKQKRLTTTAIRMWSRKNCLPSQLGKPTRHFRFSNDTSIKLEMLKCKR